MREPRNPFRLRRAESIDTETAFLTLFEPGILEVIPTGGFWETVHILRSAAGGGKISNNFLGSQERCLKNQQQRSC